MRTRAWWFTACRSTAPTGAQCDMMIWYLCSAFKTEEWEGQIYIARYVISRCTALAQPFPPMIRKGNSSASIVEGQTSPHHPTQAEAWGGRG